MLLVYAAGKWSGEGSSLCAGCDRGSYLAENKECKSCPAGTTSGLNAEFCEACPDGICPSQDCKSCFSELMRFT